jgi:uncharacterized protein YbcI
VADLPDTRELDDLSAELLRLHEEAYGKGAAEAKVIVDENSVVVFLDGLELQHNEEFMVESGQEEAVLHARSMFQQAIEASFRAAVERATGRKVVSFASVTKLDPHYSVEIFRLGEAQGPAGG